MSTQNVNPDGIIVKPYQLHTAFLMVVWFCAGCLMAGTFWMYFSWPWVSGVVSGCLGIIALTLILADDTGIRVEIPAINMVTGINYTFYYRWIAVRSIVAGLVFCWAVSGAVEHPERGILALGVVVLSLGLDIIERTLGTVLVSSAFDARDRIGTLTDAEALVQVGTVLRIQGHRPAEMFRAWGFVVEYHSSHKMLVGISSHIHCLTWQGDSWRLEPELGQPCTLGHTAARIVALRRRAGA